MAWLAGACCDLTSRRALRCSQDARKTPCIGLCTWGIVNGREHLKAARDLDHVVTLERTTPNTADGANLERNHTHFLLVDNEKEERENV